MNITEDTLMVKIIVDFEESDVDMVYRETMSSFYSRLVPSYFSDPSRILIDNSKLDKTPTAESISFCLAWLGGFVDENEMKALRHKRNKGLLEDLGFQIEETCELMQGTCSLTCSIDPDDYSKEKVNKAKKIIEDVFKKYVVYYKNRK